MSPEVTSLLNNIGLGTALIILAGFYAMGFSLYKSGLSIVKFIASKTRKQVEEESKDETIESSIALISKNVESVQAAVANIVAVQTQQQSEFNAQLASINAKLDADRQDSLEAREDVYGRMETYESKLVELHSTLSNIKDNQVLLIESDKETIKSYITDRYFEAMEHGYIPYHQLQNVESMYKKYLEENGNTFVETIMKTLRNLPSHPEDDTKIVE